MSKVILIYGGSGALGKKCVDIFKLNQFTVVSADVYENQQADFNIKIDSSNSLEDQKTSVIQALSKLNVIDNKFTAILCVAGGWAGGSAGDDDMVSNVSIMEKQCTWSSVICAHLASKFVIENGCLILTGASVAVGPTPGMLGYGMVKAGVHQLTKSLANDSTLPKGMWTGAILPITLNTEANRQNMPTADFSSWTSLDFVANLLHNWVTGKVPKPTSGSLVHLITVNNETVIKVE